MDDPPAPPCSPITFKKQFLISGFAVLAFAIVISPRSANAFSLWPFSNNNADAAVATSITNAAQPVLAAAVNFDPNPNKGLGDDMQTSGNAVIADSGPSGTIADVASSTPSDRISVYVVRPGDTLSEIASMFDVSVNTIIWANNLSGIKDVHAGDTLVILPISGVQRIVAKGDTLQSIAKKYGADANEIAQFNGLDPAEALVVGSTIIIPGGELTAPSSSTSSSGSGASGAKPVPSTQILQGQYASGNLIPFSFNPAEPARGVGHVGTTAQIDYYTSPLQHFIQTQNIHGYNAVDLAAPKGTPIMAAASGQVIIARSTGWNGGYGEYVVINHDNGSQTLYGHMSKVAAIAGEQVAQGQIIGYVGMTGSATGPHVHFEIRNGIRNPF